MAETLPALIIGAFIMVAAISVYGRVSGSMYEGFQSGKSRGQLYEEIGILNRQQKTIGDDYDDYESGVNK